MKRVKFYHPQGRSFDIVPTNGDNRNHSNVVPLGQPALDVSRPSAELSSTTLSQRPHRNLGQNKTDRPMSHDDDIETLPAMALAVTRSNVPPDDTRAHILENPIRQGRGKDIVNNLRDISQPENRHKRARR